MRLRVVSVTGKSDSENDIKAQGNALRLFRFVLDLLLKELSNYVTKSCWNTGNKML